jgi:Nodulation protein Z (NodZ)
MNAAPRKGVLLIKAKGGFGNRILSAATGVILAELTARTAVIDWRDGEYLPTGTDAYPLLFESPVDLNPADFDERRDVTPAIWSGRVGEHPVDIISQLFPNDHSNPFIYRKLSISLTRPDVPGDVAVYWSYLPKLARIRRQVARAPEFRGMSQADVARRALATYFRPNARVRREVERLFADRSRPIIGVHIRYTDRKVSLDAIIAEVTKLREQMPEAEVFLATDNQRVQGLFRERFSKVFVIEKNLGDDASSLHQQVVHDDPLREAENALIDMWALSRCDWLVHSRHSTFSVAAALIGGIPKARQRDIDRRNPRVVLKRWVQLWA